MGALVYVEGVDDIKHLHWKLTENDKKPEYNRCFVGDFVEPLHKTFLVIPAVR